MNAVRPEARTTLLLNANFLPINITTARCALNHVITGRVKPVDRFGMPHGFPEDEKGHVINDITQHYWLLMKDVLVGKTDKEGNNIPYSEEDGIYYKNQPVLRSAQGAWPIPTVALTTTRFFKHKPNGKVTIQKLAKHYKNTCQICNQVFPTSKLTIEHVIPSSKHGSTDDSNCIPTCQPCNSQKADIIPYFDVDGVNLEKKVKRLPSFLIAHGQERRDEWKDYIVFG